MSIEPPKPRHEHHTLRFPEGFLWGASTSSFQVEGNNRLSDWWEWENRTQPPDKRSGQAANQYQLYNSDFALAHSLGHNAHRLSIEWSRIEPIEGVFDLAAIKHYKEVLQSLKRKGFTVMLTLHHFSNPIWFAKKGGWTSHKSSHYFERFVRKVVPEYKDYVDFWLTVNEPAGLSLDAYGRGKFPPNQKSKIAELKALYNFAQAHKKAYYVIHQLQPKAKVGLAHNITSFIALHKHRLFENVAVWALDRLVNHSLYYLTGKKTHDFLGINYYFNSYVGVYGKKRLPSIIDASVIKKDASDMGWEIRPEGLFDVLMDMSDYNIPIYITENGIASSNDDRRIRFLLTFLTQVYQAIASGAPVKGYFFWSLLDNYEWTEGFNARFGLVEVDFESQKRTPKPSSYLYREIIKHNGIPHKLLKLLGHGFNSEEVNQIIIHSK